VRNNHLNAPMRKYVWTPPLRSNEYNAPIYFNVEFIQIAGMQMNVLIFFIKFQLIIIKLSTIFYNNIDSYILNIVFRCNHYINVLYHLNIYTSGLHLYSL
jgi:hypothetical protein